MCDPTSKHAEELSAFLAAHPEIADAVEPHCDRFSTSLVVKPFEPPRMTVIGIGVILGLPVHELPDHAGRWTSWFVTVPLPTTTLRITTPPVVIPAQRAA